MARAQKLFQKANSKFSVVNAAWLLAGSTFIAAALGFYRDRLLNRTYLNNLDPQNFLPEYMDAYLAAFRIPDFMYFVLVSGALSVTFIPVFSARLVAGSKRSAWDLSSSLLNLLAIVTLITSILIMIFADPLIRHIVAPGLPDDVRDLAISMMRVIAINPFLFAISSLLASMQQAVGRFFFFTLAPVIYNIGIIIGILFLTQEISLFGNVIWEGGIMGVALGVALGSIMQLLVSSFGMIGMKFDYRPLIFWKNKGFRQVLRLLPPRSFDQGMDYFTTLVETNIASRLGGGALSYYQMALTLHFMPINLIGVAISTAFFPKMADRMATGQIDMFRSEMRSVLRVIIWLALPVSALIYVTRGYLVGLLFEGGQATVASILSLLVVAVLFRSIFHIASRGFYAQQDTKTPLYISIAVITLHIVLAISFFQMGMGVEGLAIAQSIVAVTEVLILFFIMQARIGGIFTGDFWTAIMRMLSATGLMFIVSYLMVQLLPFEVTNQTFFAVSAKLFIIGLVSLTAYLFFSQLFGLSESRPIIEKFNKLKSLVFKNISSLNTHKK